MEKCSIWVVIVLSLIGAVNAQTPAASGTSPAPVFDVAVIKPTDTSVPLTSCFMRGQPGGQTFVGRCIPLRLMIKYAYKIVDDQISGGPGWMDSQLFDFDAKSDRSVTRAEVAEMFQRFLADRFQLQLHRENRTMSAYVLTVDKGGSKMTKSESTYEWEIPVQPIPGPIPKFKGIRCPMYYFSWFVGQSENRPVVDKTGLPGFWDFTLEFVPEALQNRRGANGDPIPAPDGPNLATALRDQLGLKLERDKTPVEVYIIDHVEKPVN